jgi:hypothetical protein
VPSAGLLFIAITALCRERHNEPRGLVYTLWNLPNWQEELRQHAQGNPWLDQAKRYGKCRQEAVIQANMPVRSSAAPVPYTPKSGQ